MRDGERVPYVNIDGQLFASPKGYTCPEFSECQVGENPYGGTIGFDNIFQSIEMVFVMMSFNTFTDIMYDIIDAEHLIASLFFIIGSLALGLWLANLFIAVIVTSLKSTREEESYAANKGDPVSRVAALFAGTSTHVKYICRNKIGRAYHYCREVPLIFIFADLIVQCTVDVSSDDDDVRSVYLFQIFVTALLGLDIAMRFCIYLPKVRLFFSSPMNCVDLTLAVLTSIILIDPIYQQKIVYAWLSVFQLARFYRVIIAVPFVRDLWARVVSDFKPIFDITIFYFLFTHLAAILACQLLRGVIPLYTDGELNFFAFQHLANSFVAMYTISTTENWTAIMYTAVQSADSNFSRACIAAFFIGWFIVSNYIVLNMFVAIITDNLAISLEGKRQAQIKSFVIDIVNEQPKSSVFKDTRDLLLDKFNIKKKGVSTYTEQTALQLIAVDNMETFLPNEEAATEYDQERRMLEEKNSRSLFKTIKKLPFLPGYYLHKRRQKRLRDNPFHESHEIRDYQTSDHKTSDAIVADLLEAKNDLEKQRKQYLLDHPGYNRSLRIFSPRNRIRKFCQKIVAPSYGVRLEGHNPRPLVWYLFSTCMSLATLALVIIAVVVTPIYYKTLSESHPHSMNWVIITDIIFVVIFTLESLIKIIADGLYLTPNAYFRSIWGIIDFAVLITMWINMIEEMRNANSVSRMIRAFKAFRALRLLSFSPRAQELFHSVIVVGSWKLFSAAFVGFGLLFPFSVWGLNIFSGRLFSCNNDGFQGDLSQCVGEFQNSPFNWNVNSPLAVVNSYFDFNTFGHSLLALFEIISLEGWVDILEAVMNISPGLEQPEYYANAYNGIFVMLYNLVSTVFILTLFISVIIQNYSVVRGSAFMTGEQQTWYEIESALSIVRPSMRPRGLTQGSFRYKIFQSVIEPNSWLNIFNTLDLVAITIILMTMYYPRSRRSELGSNVALFVFVAIYLAFVGLKLYALGPKKFFRRRWDIYALLVTCTSTVLVFCSLFWVDSQNTLFFNFQRVFVVGMLILLMPRSRRLDQLLKTCSSSVSSIGNLMLVWAILFLAYGIAFNQVFGLTRIGPNGSTSKNFRYVPRALVLLYRMSCGEGWNQIMHDYTVEYPECYVAGDEYTDCGSKGYAYVLFISWNILSMYIFANMFVSLVYENFSYVSRKPDGNINRDEIRKFKQAWFLFDPDATGYIPRSKFYELLNHLDGYFSLKIHDEPWKVPSILRNSMAETTDKYQVDLDALNKELRRYPVKDFVNRRHLLEKFCQHAFLLADPERGINFNKLLLQFPFYKDLKYSESLKLRDYIKYRDIERRVRIRTLQERSAGAILMAQCVVRRRFTLNKMRQGTENPFASPLDHLVPSIQVDDVDGGDDDRF